MRKMLFICSGNTCRSPMAQGLFTKHLEERNPELKGKVQVLTAGTSPVPGQGPSPGALEVMKELGVDLSDHMAQAVTKEMLTGADWVLTMTGDHRNYLVRIFGDNEKLYTLYGFLGKEKDVLDPYRGNTDTYRACRDELEKLMMLLLQKLEKELG